MNLETHEKQSRTSRIIFVGGAPRSGTTLVQRLLDAHSQIAAGPELNCLTEISLVYKKMALDLKNNRTCFYFDEQELNQIFKDFIKSIFINLYSKYNVSIVSEKTPSNVLIFEFLLKIIPESRYIFVVRDPKDIICSYMDIKRKYLTGKI